MHEYANEIISYRTIVWMNLLNCIIDDIKTYNNGDLMLVWGWNQFIYDVFFMFSLIFKVFKNIHEYAN